MTHAQQWLLAFVWTNALELPVYALVLQCRFDRWWAVVVLTFALNALTHPLLWFVVPQWAPFWLYAMVVEGAVIVVEAAVVAGVLLAVDRRRPVLGIALAAAAAANTVSAVVGGIVFHALVLA